MKQAVKATVLILFASLLSGCSSSPNPADKPQVKSECDEVKESQKQLTTLGQGKSRNEVLIYTLIAQNYLLENTKCFTTLEIATAKSLIDFLNNEIANR